MTIGAQALIYSPDKAKVLLVKRNDFFVWTLPGGRKDKGESLEETVIREMQEETGFKVKILYLLGIYRVWYFPPAGRTHVFVCQKISGSFRRNKEVKELKFWPVKHLPFNLLPYLRKRIKDGLKYEGK